MKLFDDNTLSALEKEIKTHSAISNHPNIVRLFGYCEELKAVVMEYAPFGSMEDLLIEKKQFNYHSSKKIEEEFQVMQVFKKIKLDSF